MLGGRKWRTIGILVLAPGVLVVACGWLGLHSRLAREEDFQRRIASWGGRSQALPLVHRSESLTLLRFRNRIRGYVGDRLYYMLAGSRGRAVVNGGQPGMTCDWRDATPAQLAELLEVQPIKSATLAGSKHLGDDWLAGLQDPGAMISLALDGTEVTDRSAEVIVKMHSLDYLSLVDTAISDAEVFRLCRLPRLDYFAVGGPNIRALRLVDPRILDESGARATRAQGMFRLEGSIEMALLPGATENIRVLVRPEGDPTLTEIYTKQALSSIELESPRSYRFRIDLAGLPPGRSSVEVWIDHRPGFTTALVQYRMPPFSIELAVPEASDEARANGLRRSLAGGR